MRIGLYYDMRNPRRWERPWKGFYGQVLEQIEEAERRGIGAIWLSEHHGWADGYLPQPLTMAAAVAARTKRVRIGAGIVLAPLRPAVDIAEQTAIVDLISDGRMELGLGAGYVMPEFRAYGADMATRFEAMEQRAVDVRRLWAEGRATPAPLQERLPIWIGGIGPRSARIAGRTGEFLLWPGPEGLKPYRRALVRAGHDPNRARVGGLCQMIIADDPERVWNEVRPHLKYQWASYNYYGGLDVETPGMMLLEELEPEELRSKEVALTAPRVDVVTADEAIARLSVWARSLPLDHLFFWSSIAGMPDQIVARHTELLSGTVAPAMRDIGIPVADT